MSKTFCPLPFTHLNIKHEGKVSACWRYPDRVGDWQETSLTDVWNDAPQRELRRALLNDEQPPGCRACWDSEKGGGSSTRKESTIQWQDTVTEEHVRANISEDYSYPHSEMRSVEIRFDNICNLMCRHCSPDYSSVWEQRVKKDDALLDKMKQYGTYRKQKSHIRLTDEMIDEVTLKFAPSLEEIMIAGGEPLYHDKHYRFLENLQPHAHKLRLSYNTNLNTLDYKGKSIVDLWAPFKELWVRISLDGDPHCYEYNRVASNLDKVEENIRILNERVPQADVSASCTVSLYNITRFVNIIEYFIGLDVYFHTSLVQYPQALNIRLLPQHLKDKVTADFNNWLSDNPLEKIRAVSNKVDPERQLMRITKFGNNVMKYMNSEDRHELWHEFIDYSSALDEHHNTNLFDIFPEYKL